MFISNNMTQSACRKFTLTIILCATLDFAPCLAAPIKQVANTITVTDTTTSLDANAFDNWTKTLPSGMSTDGQEGATLESIDNVNSTDDNSSSVDNSPERAITSPSMTPSNVYTTSTSTGSPRKKMTKRPKPVDVGRLVGGLLVLGCVSILVVVVVGYACSHCVCCEELREWCTEKTEVVMDRFYLGSFMGPDTSSPATTAGDATLPAGVKQAVGVVE